jgi:hypothetical protein
LIVRIRPILSDANGNWTVLEELVSTVMNPAVDGTDKAIPLFLKQNFTTIGKHSKVRHNRD